MSLVRGAEQRMEAKGCDGNDKQLYISFYKGDNAVNFNHRYYSQHDHFSLSLSVSLTHTLFLVTLTRFLSLSRKWVNDIRNYSILRRPRPLHASLFTTLVK